MSRGVLSSWMISADLFLPVRVQAGSPKMSRIHLLWLFAAVGVQLASAHPALGPSSRTSKRAALLETYRFDTVSTYTTLDQNNDGSSTASLKRGNDADEDGDGDGDGTAPSYVRAATSQVLKAVPGASSRLVDNYYVGANSVGYVHFQQVIDGIDVDNAHFKVNVGCQVAPQSRYKPSLLFLQSTADRPTRSWKMGLFCRSAIPSTRTPRAT